MKKIYSVLAEKFPASEGYRLSISYYETIGKNIDPSEFEEVEQSEEKKQEVPKEKFECYAKNDKGRWFFVGWYPIMRKVVRENDKYWFTEEDYKYKKPTQSKY